MATVKAVIRRNKVNSKGQVLIYIRYGHKELSVDFSTKLKIYSDEWNPQNEQVLLNNQTNEKSSDSVFDTGSDQINQLVNIHKRKILNISNDLRLKEIEPTVKRVKEVYKKDELLESEVSKKD